MSTPISRQCSLIPAAFSDYLRRLFLEDGASLSRALLWGEVLVYPGSGLCCKIELSNFVHSYIIFSVYLIVCRGNILPV